jgi:hypothetical protein
MALNKQPPGEPMTLGNMRKLGVHHLVAFCLRDACRHQGLIDVSKYPDDTEVPSFGGIAEVYQGRTFRSARAALAE